MTSIQTINIFLADDDIDDVLIFKEALKECSFKSSLTEFVQSKEICEQIFTDSRKPDLIFLDINMPIVNGKDCLKEIRKNENFNDIPVIMYSTSENNGEVDETFIFGANIYVCKPNSIPQLVSILEDIYQFYRENKLKDRNRTTYLYRYK